MFEKNDGRKEWLESTPRSIFLFGASKSGNGRHQTIATDWKCDPYPNLRKGRGGGGGWKAEWNSSSTPEKLRNLVASQAR